MTNEIDLPANQPTNHFTEIVILLPGTRCASCEIPETTVLLVPKNVLKESNMKKLYCTSSLVSADLKKVSGRLKQSHKETGSKTPL